MAERIGTRKDERSREKQAKLDDEVRALVITDIMSTKSGRAYIWEKLETCHCFHQSFIPGQADSTAFNEGARSVGLAILADILTSCPDSYILAQRESNERSTITERRRSPDIDGRDSGPVLDASAGGEADGTGDSETSSRSGEDPFNGPVPIGYAEDAEVRRRILGDGRGKDTSH